MDELRLCIINRKRILDCKIMIFTETWLNSGIPDSAIELTRRYILRADRIADDSADRGEEKEDGTFAGAEELLGTTSESDTSTFHGFEEDELEEPAANGNGISNRHR